MTTPKDVISDLVGRQVATRRLGRGLTQDEVADKVGISRQALSEIERGTQSPRWETLYRIAQALHCEPFDLLPSLRQVLKATQ